MKIKLLPLAICLLAVACNNARKGGVAGDAVSINAPAQGDNGGVVNTTGSVTDNPTTTTVDKESAFCEPGHVYSLPNLVVKSRFIEREEGQKLKSDRPVLVYFQDGAIIEKEDLDQTKISCSIQIFVKKRIATIQTKKEVYSLPYTIRGQIEGQGGAEEVNGSSACSQQVEPPKLKRGKGFFDKITCSGKLDNQYTVKEVIAAIGEKNLIVQDASAKSVLVEDGKEKEGDKEKENEKE